MTTPTHRQRETPTNIVSPHELACLKELERKVVAVGSDLGLLAAQTSALARAFKPGGV